MTCNFYNYLAFNSQNLFSVDGRGCVFVGTLEENIHVINF